MPFGRRQVVGVVLARAVGGAADEPTASTGKSSTGDQTGSGTQPAKPAYELKSISSVIDESPAYSPQLLELAHWLSSWYLHPIGEVLRTMLPAGASKQLKSEINLTDAGDGARKSPDHPHGPMLSALFGKKRQKLALATWKSKLTSLGHDPDALLKTLRSAGLVTPSQASSARARKQAAEQAVKQSTNSETIAEEPSVSNSDLRPPTFAQLTDAQQKVFSSIAADQDKPGKPWLLRGVTGSGKTEIYLHLIRRLLASTEGGAQAIMLVPEISLTPQMTRVFSSRFPGRVAVVHSAMTDADRWQQLERMRTGDADVLIGPRSAIFAPCSNLKLIIVDEEHDGSYKQTTGLTYNGRDVAVVRGKIEQALVLLGSATPSLESWQNALTGKYQMAELPERVTGRPLPEVQMITSENAFKKGTIVARSSELTTGGKSASASEVSAGELRDTPIDRVVLDALRHNKSAGEQAIVLVNRRGYAYYLFSLEKRSAIQCPQCSISLTLHARSSILRCHYCDHTTNLTRIVAAHPEETLVAIGYGSEKAEDCIRSEISGIRVVRLDSDTVTHRDVLPDALGKFREGETDVLVGTQMLAKGHDFPNVTLIAILEVDQLLELPDFRSGERTFQLIVQAAGRAGRAEKAGRVLIQSARTNHPVIRLALAQDFRAFAERELSFRKAHGYPPFARMIAVEFNGTDFNAVRSMQGRLEEWLERTAVQEPGMFQGIRVLGPSVPPIEMVRGRLRRQVIFVGEQPGSLRRLAQKTLQNFGKLPGDMRIKIDVDPQSLI